MSLWQLAVPHLQTSSGGLNLGVRAQPFLLHGQFSPGSLANPGKRRIGGYNSDYRHNLAFSHCFAIQTLLSIAPVDERFYEQDEIG